MSLSIQEIEAGILMLPEQEQQKIIDFVLAQQKKPRTQSDLLVDVAKTLPKIACFENQDPLELQKAMRDEWD